MSSWSGWGQKCPADETYPNCVSDLRYLRDKDSLPTDSVQFALTETHSLILDTNRGLPGISSPANYYTGCGVKKWKIKDRNSLKLMHSSRTLYPVLMLRGVKIVANSTLMVL